MNITFMKGNNDQQTWNPVCNPKVQVNWEKCMILISAWPSSSSGFYFMITNRDAFWGYRPLRTLSGPDLGIQSSGKISDESGWDESRLNFYTEVKGKIQSLYHNQNVRLWYVSHDTSHHVHLYLIDPFCLIPSSSLPSNFSSSSFFCCFSCPPLLTSPVCSCIIFRNSQKPVHGVLLLPTPW